VGIKGFLMLLIVAILASGGLILAAGVALDGQAGADQARSRLIQAQSFARSEVVRAQADVVEAQGRARVNEIEAKAEARQNEIESQAQARLTSAVAGSIVAGVILPYAIVGAALVVSLAIVASAGGIILTRHQPVVREVIYLPSPGMTRLEMWRTLTNNRLRTTKRQFVLSGGDIQNDQA